MRTAALKITLLSALASCTALAQNSDLAILTAVKIQVGDQILPSGRTDAGISMASASQLTYALQVLDARPGGLYLELPLIEGGNGFGNIDIFFTPGVRFKFSTQSRFSPYVALGAGVFSAGGTTFSSRTTSAALGFGAGFDVRFTRLLSLRTDLRDFVTRSRMGKFEGRNRQVFSLGLAFHF
jgi:hypothetical protein